MNKNKDQSGAAVRGEAVAREYFYKVDACKAEDGKSPECICWHKEGTGPLANRPHEVRNWRQAAPVSARAADAPSEPSEPILTMAQVNAIRDTIKPGDGWDGDNWDFALANAVAAAVKSRAADALDSQPTDQTAELESLGAEVARLQDALCFWLPSVTEREDEVALRILEDAFLLVGADGNLPPDFKSAQELGWIALQPATSKGWVLALQTVVEMPNGKNELGHTMLDGVGIFTSFDEVVKAKQELSLPLGWVAMTTQQLLPGWQIPEVPPEASSQPTDGGVRNG